MGKSIRSKKGFTLVELMVSATILAAIVAGIVVVLTTGRDLQVVDGNRRQARILIHQRMERVYDYRTYNGINDTLFTVLDTLSVRGVNPILAQVTTNITTDLVNMRTGTPVEVKKINVTVRWEESDGDTEVVSLSKWLAGAE